MIRFNLHLYRGFILWWCLGIWAFLAVTPPAYVSYYPSLSDRGSLVEGMRDNVGTTAMYGVFPEPGTIGQFTTWETGAWLAILSAIMAVLLISMLHRSAESKGSAETLQALGLTPTRILISAYAAVSIVSLLVGSGSALVLITLRYISTKEISASGSLSFGIMLTLIMIASMAIASIVQSLFGSENSTTRLGLFTVAFGFLARMVADTAETTFLEFLNWLTPLGWRALILPFTDDNWARTAALGLMSFFLILVGLVLNTRREFNSALITFDRRSRATPHRISSTLGLDLLTNRATILSWSLISGLIILTMLPLIDSLIPLLSDDNATLEILQDLLPVGDMQTEFIVYIFQLVAILVAVAVTQPVVNHIKNEREGLVDSVLSTGKRRQLPMLSAIRIAVITAISCALFSMVAGLVALTIQDGEVVDGIQLVCYAALSLIPQTLVFIGISAAIAGLWPKLIHLSWIPILAAATVSILGLILGMTEEQINFSPLSHTLTPTNADWQALLLFSVLGLSAMGIGLIGIKRRDVL